MQYAVRKDFSFQTRLARKKLLGFAKTKGASFKLRVDKLRMNDTEYTYDPVSDTVTECT